MSHYLFVLCMKKFSHVISNAVSEGKWKPIKLSRTGPTLSHLFFENDLVLFAESSVDQFNTVM